MKKQVIGTLLILSMAVGLCACGNAEESKEEISNDTSVVAENEVATAEVDAETDTDVESERPEWLSHLYEDPFFDWSIWLTNVDYGDAGYGYKCKGTAEKFSEVIYITEYCGEVGDERQKEEIDISKYQTSEDIFELLAPNFNYEIFGIGCEMINYSSEIIETKEINGMQMTRFEGNMEVLIEGGTVEDTYCTYPFVAYGIAAKNTPVLVTCIDQSEDQRYHEEWLTKIDDLVATFKDAE